MFVLTAARRNSLLLDPVRIGELRVSNRIVMPAMGTGFWTEDGLVTEKVLSYYEARARGGAGLIIVENASVDFYRGMHVSNRPTADSDDAIPGLRKLAARIKKHGTRAILQLNHAGRIAKSRLGGFQPIAPSPISFSSSIRTVEEIPRSLTVEEVARIPDLFASAATRAVRAGFDGIEVHAAHHYLIAQFLSRHSNKRDDEYGGNMANRIRLLLDVLRACRENLPAKMPLWCRVNGIELGCEDGLAGHEVTAIVKMLDGLVDAVSVTAYGYGQHSAMSSPDRPGAFVPFAKALRPYVNVPLILAGRIDAEMGEALIREGTVDLVAMGRGLIADPDIGHKLAEGNGESIRPCIACYRCLDSGAARNTCLTCSVNPAVGKEASFRIQKASRPKRVVIIGGGPAGMEAARVLAMRGHRPVIIEKEDVLGGQLNAAVVPPAKLERLGPLLEWYKGELKRLGVEIRFGVEANKDVVMNLDPDKVILATGALPLIPHFPGAGHPNIVTAVAALRGRAEVRGHTIVVGGGSVGCETSDWLSGKVDQVTLVEMLPDLAQDMGGRERFRLLSRLKEGPARILTQSRCVAVFPKGVTVASPEGEVTLRADTVILALGMNPNNSLYLSLRDSGMHTRMAGDCWRVGRIGEAIYDGARLAVIS